jgi:hypothetical protein
MQGETILPYTEVKRILDLVRSVAKPAEVPYSSSTDRRATRGGSPILAFRWS